MKAIAWLMAATVATALLTGVGLAADKKNSELIVGKWSPDDAKGKEVVIEFTKGGEVKISLGAGGMNITINGKYKVVDEKTIELSMDSPDKKDEVKTQKLTIKSISAEEAVIITPEGKEEKLKAVK
jgi:uncharacterized protein (TIGR03066 family)